MIEVPGARERHGRIGARRVGWRVALLVALLGSMVATAAAGGPVLAAPITLFEDGFESGTLGAWTVTTGGDGTVTVGSSPVRTGSYAAQLSESATAGSQALVRKDLGSAYPTLQVSGSFQVTAEGAAGSNVPLIRLFDASGTRVVSLYRQNLNADRLYVQLGSTFLATTGFLPLGTWGDLSLSVTFGSPASVSATLNGTPILSGTSTTVSATGARTVQLGNEVKAQAMGVVADDIVVTTDTGGAPPPPDTTITDGPQGTVSSASATFSFTSPDTSATFECKLDSGSFAGCVSPATFSGLAQGDHTFAVRAVNATGPDPTPATRAWTVDLAGQCATGAPPPSNSDPGTVVIAENFEGDLSNWTKVTAQGDASVGIQSDVYKNGGCALLEHVTTAVWDSRANITKSLPSGTSEIWLTGWFNTLRQGLDQGWNTPTFRIFSNGKRVVDFSRQNVTGNFFLRYTNGSGGWSYIMANKVMNMNRWYEIKLHAIANGNLSTVEVWVDGQKKVNTTTATLGVWRFDVVMVGAEHQNQDGDVAADDVVVKAIVPPPSNTIFADGFESGSLGAWSIVQVGGDGTAAAQSNVVKSGGFAGRFTATTNAGSFAYARQAFLAAQDDLMVTADIRVAGQGPSGTSVPLIYLFDAGGARQVSLYRLNGSGALRIDHSGASFPISATLPMDTWMNVRVHTLERGPGSVDLVEVWANGALVYGTSTADLGSSGPRTLQIGNNVSARAMDLYVDNVEATVGSQSLGNDPRYKLLIADMLNKRLVITDFDGNVVWQWVNPTGSSEAADGPIGVRWMPGNQILATFGLGTVGLIDVASKSWVWKVKGFNGDWFQSPYDAELLPDGNLAVATRFNNGGRVTVYNRTTGEVVWKHMLKDAHSVHFRPQGYNYNGPTMLVGGFGNIREVAYTPNGGSQVTWQVKSEYTHEAMVVENDRLLTTEGYYIQKIERSGAQVWKKMTPDEDRRFGLNPNVGGGYVFTVAEADRIEFRDINGNLLRDWSMLSDGTALDYPYGIQVIDYPG